MIYHESSENAEKIAKEIDGMPIKADLRDHKQALSLIDAVIEKYGKLDICIANAGYYPPESLPLWDIGNDRWNEINNCSFFAYIVVVFTQNPSNSLNIN